MKKIETIWHHILTGALNEGGYRYTQQELARRFHYSLSTIHHALRIPAEIGAIRKAGKFFVLQDFKKLLFYWASFRKLTRDLLYGTSLDLPVQEIEGLALPGSLYGANSAAKRFLAESPADYSKVYFYILPGDLAQFRRRFPPSSKKSANTFALKMLPMMREYGPTTTLTQTFVDLWNLTDWYARDFHQALEEKIDGLLSQSRH